MPVINLIPIFIATYEIMYLTCDQIPYKVSIDEALELAKTYSDDQGRILVNGILNSLKDRKAELLDEFSRKLPENHYFFIH